MAQDEENTSRPRTKLIFAGVRCDALDPPNAILRLYNMPNRLPRRARAHPHPHACDSGARMDHIPDVGQGIHPEAEPGCQQPTSTPYAGG